MHVAAFLQPYAIMLHVHACVIHAPSVELPLPEALCTLLQASELHGCVPIRYASGVLVRPSQLETAAWVQRVKLVTLSLHYVVIGAVFALPACCRHVWRPGVC
jgi:hypothetical protein